MKNTLRVLSAISAVVLCVGLLAACGGIGTKTQPTTTATPTTEATTGTEVFVAPPDAVGKVISADSILITWNAYAIEDETIDFMGLNEKELKDPSADMSLFYLEEDVSYYLIKDGKLVDAVADDVVPGAVIGVTTLEEGVQEVYIISVPVEDDGSNVIDDTVEEIVDVVVATTSATEETVLEDSGEVVATDPQ